MPRSDLKVICVLGPTASGKSDLAERLALARDGEIVSADSMQVYRGMDIGTAKVSRAARRVSYHCVDIVDPGEPYSAALFQRDARAAISDIQFRGKAPILCGGTGFYVRAALDDLDFAPGGQVNNQTREHYTRLARELGNEGLHALLARRDPESAALVHPNDVKRVVRAFEMLEAGESYAHRKRAFREVPELIPSVKIGLRMDRDLLYERIDERVDVMFSSGLVEEVMGLLEQGLREALTAREAIGYKEVVAALEGTCTMREAREDIKKATRHYAKRQITWLRSDGNIHWLDVGASTLDEITDEALRIVDTSL